MSSSPWEVARTLIAASGLGVAGVALGSACLDYAGEDFGTCEASDAGTPVGSGDGNGVASGADCGAPPSAADAGVLIGSGSGSATP